MKFTIQGKRDIEMDMAENSTLLDLMRSYGKKVNKDMYRCTFKPLPSKNDEKPKSFSGIKKTLSQLNITDGTTITFKDIGPQIGYSTVFYTEYFGPMLFVALWALRPDFIYGNDYDSYSSSSLLTTDKATFLNAWSKFHPVAQLGIICWMVHFLKREFETAFVHKFSRPTMPLSNLFKNCTYYWTFGAIIGYPLCSPFYNESVIPSSSTVQIGLIIFIVSELCNLYCHIILSSLRPASGSDVRPIPKGFLFDYVSCPNYTFEVMSWIGFSIMTGLVWSWLFTLVGALQMTEWAVKKHKLYKNDKNTGDEYKKLGRKAIIPFVL